MAAGPPDGASTGAEFGQLVAWLTSLVPPGPKRAAWMQDIAAVLGNSPAGRTRAQVAVDLRELLKNRPPEA